MDVDTILDELNIDDLPGNRKLIQNLIEQSQDIIINSVDSTRDLAYYQNNKIFIRAVNTLVTNLFYDRTLNSGMSRGLKMMINHLKGQVEYDEV